MGSKSFDRDQMHWRVGLLLRLFYVFLPYMGLFYRVGRDHRSKIICITLQSVISHSKFLVQDTFFLSWDEFTVNFQFKLKHYKTFLLTYMVCAHVHSSV